MSSFKLPPDPVIVIAGPTASGKSGLAMQFARALRMEGRACEIICADSITVYKGFETGAAKPTAEERAEFKHHLLDVASPIDGFTAGDFVRWALPAILGIHARKAIPLLVGGTGFYLRALLRGMASDEKEDVARAASIKAKLEERAAKEGWEALHSEVIRKDPGSAATVHSNDHYRVMRALQAMELYGKPWSELNTRARAAGFRFPGTRFFCLDIDREILRARIEARTHVMLEHGLMQEVQGLIHAGVPPTAKPMQSVGYKECVDTLSGAETMETLAARITQATMKLAKQQRTWFRGEAGVEMLKPDFWESLRAAL